MARNSRDAYGFGTGGPSPALAPRPEISNRAPITSDINLEIGTIWIDTITNQSWTLTSIVSRSATWVLSSSGSSDLETLTGDSGGAINPAGGNITLAGGTNITTVGVVNTITYNLDPAITLATSVTAPLYTSAAAMAITCPGVFTLDAVTSLDIECSVGDIGIGNDPVTQAVNIGTGASQKNITIGNGSVASSVILEGGTGAIQITTTGAGDIIATAGGAIQIDSVNDLEINASTGAIHIGNDANTQPINIGTGASSRVITLGNTTGASELRLRSGTIGINLLTGGVGSPIDVDATGALSLNSSGGAILIGDDAVAQSIQIGTGAAQRGITIGNLTGTTTLNLNAGTGEVNVASNLHIATTGTTLKVKGGIATDFIGQTTLVAGTITILNTNIAAGDRIFLSRSSLAASPVLGHLIATINVGVSFVITSYTNAGVLANTDVSQVDYFIVRQS